MPTVVERVKPPIETYLIFHKTEASTSAQWVDLARRYLSGAKIGAGTNAYFTDLNRGRPPVDALDLVCYSINPQVHAFDNSSLKETLEAQAVTVKSTRLFTDGLPIAVTPVTLLARFNPNATGPEPEPAPGGLPTQVDIRQMSLFGAGWTPRQHQVSIGKRCIECNLLRNEWMAGCDGDRERFAAAREIPFSSQRGLSALSHPC